MEEIVIRISPDGRSAKIDALGFVGPACEVAKKIAAGLGQVIESERKPEFYLEDHEQARQHT